MQVFSITNYVLLPLSWAIINSIWQGLLAWLFYKVTTQKNSSSIFKYRLGQCLLFIVFLLFIYNLILGINSVCSFEHLQQSGLAWVVGSSALIYNFPLVFQLIATIYLLACIFYFARFTNNLILASKLPYQKHLKAPLDFRLFASKTAMHFGIKKKVELFISQDIDTPCVAGFFKPVVLLPFTLLNNLTTDQAEAIIVHELAHIKRNDYIINLFQCIIDIILFFNPFAILLSRSIRRERENCCDDWVMTYQYDKQAYAAALLLLEQHRSVNLRLLPAATGAKEGWLLSRIKRLFIEIPKVDITGYQKLKLTAVSLTIVIALIIGTPVLQKEIPASQLHVISVYSNKIKINNQFNSEQVKALTFAPSQTKTAAANQKALVKKSKPASVSRVTTSENQDESYTLALVNNDLLNEDKEAERVASNIALSETTVDSISRDYIIKVEIEQNGSNDRNAYLFEYNKNIDGQTNIKPLMLVLKKPHSKANVIYRPKQDYKLNSLQQKVKITL